MVKLMSSKKFRSALLSTVLNQGSKYAGGSSYLKQFKMIQATIDRPAIELAKDGKELQYLIDEFRKLQEMGYTRNYWKDSLSSMLLYKQVEVECGLSVLECIVVDPFVVRSCVFICVL